MFNNFLSSLEVHELSFPQSSIFKNIDVLNNVKSMNNNQKQIKINEMSNSIS